MPGVYGAAATSRTSATRFDASSRARDRRRRDAGVLRFPPVIPREQIEDIGYLESFPHLAGTVFAFEGTEARRARMAERAARHEDWAEHQCMTDLVLTPAVCYPVYPAIAAAGRCRPAA